MAVILLVVLSVDQFTKQAARRALVEHAPCRYFRGLVTLVYAENAGGFLSLGSELPSAFRRVAFSGVAAACLLGLGVFLARREMEHATDEIALTLVLSGGIGNMIDRVLNDGLVVDFIYLAAGPLHTGVFNVADMAITGGAGWLLLAGLIRRSHRREQTLGKDD